MLKIKIIFIGLVLGFLTITTGAPRPAAAIDVTDIPLPGVSIAGMSRTEIKICQIRRIFCGETGVVIGAVAVFMMGIMLLNNKLHWSTASLFLIGMVIFYNANDVARGFAGATFLFIVENPVCDCHCKVDFEALAIGDFSGLEECVPETGGMIDPF